MLCPFKHFILQYLLHTANPASTSEGISEEVVGGSTSWEEGHLLSLLTGIYGVFVPSCGVSIFSGAGVSPSIPVGQTKSRVGLPPGV